MGILIQEPGLFTTVQDEGRYGYQQFGVTPSGPMDARSFHIANLLVGNNLGEGALEMTFQGPTMKFEEANVVAVTGADMKPTLNGKPVPMYEAFVVEKDDVLKFQFAMNGSRGYVAFAGGLDIPLLMESKSTLASKGLGGVDGRKLQKEDHIGFTAPKKELPHMESRKVTKPEFPNKEVVLRVIRGPQDDCFSEEEIRRFFWYGFKVTNEFDRMGCRLERSEPVKHLQDGNIISDGIACGSIQVPTNGQPIIMLADRQTVGGYTKIGTVISVDLSKLAQAKPGMDVRFVEVSLELAQDLYIRELEEMEQADKLLNQA
ncbi:biotin-dependent carboxyltransferase family protein [Clostridiaceae bacterium Marseille-Q4145]|nr:biotin-dependent carboxyltransferase family protein [Clostridiaceae bacterium Marseille-Q4145]